MKWDETIASKCRYGDIAGRIFGECDIIWEDSEAEYQGYAEILAYSFNGRFIHYKWFYGSCSGCDEWESRGLSMDEIVAEMRRDLAVLETLDQVLKYIDGDLDKHKDMQQKILEWFIRNG